MVNNVSIKYSKKKLRIEELKKLGEATDDFIRSKITEKVASK